jgi:hypothetical protein
VTGLRISEKESTAFWRIEGNIAGGMAFANSTVTNVRERREPDEMVFGMSHLFCDGGRIE